MFGYAGGFYRQIQEDGVIISSNDAETCWNAFRFANFCLNSKDEVQVFLIGKGVEYQQISSPEFNIVEQAEKLLGAGGKVFACGTCLKQLTLKNPFYGFPWPVKKVILLLIARFYVSLFFSLFILLLFENLLIFSHNQRMSLDS